MIETLKAIALFSELDKAELEKLSNISRIKNYKQGEILFFEKEKPLYMYVLKSGEIRIFKTNTKGAQIFLHNLKPITLVAELSNFEDIPYPATAEFAKDSEVIAIDFKKVDKDFFKNPNISFKIARSFSQKLCIISEVLHREVSLSAEAKVAKFLLEDDSYFGTIKDAKIASMLNITPETLSRTLTKFKKEGLIKQGESRKIIYKNEEALVGMIE